MLSRAEKIRKTYFGGHLGKWRMFNPRYTLDRSETQQMCFVSKMQPESQKIVRILKIIGSSVIFTFEKHRRKTENRSFLLKTSVKDFIFF